MIKPISLLSGLLVLQLAITGVLFSTDSGMADNMTPQSLVNINKDALKRIEIKTDNETLVLSKNNQRWQLEDYPELPLLASKISSLTDDLATTEVSWPVTSTKSSHERFKVTQDNYEKHIVFTDQNGNESALLIGKSPSFKQLYVRDLEQNDVYSIEYSAYQLSTDASDWLDKSLLAIDGISQINHSVISLKKSDDAWQLASSSLDEQQQLDTQSIEDLVNQLTSLSVSGIAEASHEASDKLTVVDNNNQTYIYSFAASQQRYFVKRDDINHWFTIPKYQFEKFADLSLEQFISDDKKQQEEKAAEVSE